MANHANDSRAFSKAEAILRGYGIDCPSQIDLEAVAYDMKATVRYRKLDGSEARIVGDGASAIITVQEGGQRPRQRFSIAHEIGHWIERHGRGGFVCAKEDISPQNDREKSAEAEANVFASQLILPSYLFNPMVEGLPITLDTADKIGREFQASLTATAIKLIRSTAKPAAVVCHSQVKRDWFASSRGFPDGFWLANELGYDTDAFELLYAPGEKGKTPVRQEDASRWFSGRDARSRKVRSQSVKIADGVVLSIIELLN